MQVQLLAICDDLRNTPTAIGATPSAAAPGNAPSLPAGLNAELHYDPGMVPQPVLLPGGYTLYPGETAAVQIPTIDLHVAPSEAKL